MDHDPNQGFLPLEMAPDPFGTFWIVCRAAKDRPEVSYSISWSLEGEREEQVRVWLDRIWPMDRMVVRIISMIQAAHPDGIWERKRVLAILNQLQAAYGLEEPF